jgi:hypothetical protein
MAAESDAEFAIYRELMNRANKYLYSNFSTSNCTPEVAREWGVQHGLFLQEYLSSARILNQRYPESPFTRDVFLHALLMTGTYEAVKAYAEDTMARFGTVRVPFYSKARPFWLVIDGKKREIRNEGQPGYASNTGITDGLIADRPFSFDYSAAAPLRQTIGVDLNLMQLAPKTEVVHFGSGETAPYPAFLHMMFCLYGETAAREYAWKTAKLVADLAGIPPASVSLPDPGKKSRDWLNTFTVVGGVSAVVVVGAIDAANQSGRYPNSTTAQTAAARETLMQSADALMTEAAMNTAARQTTQSFQDEDFRTLRSQLSREAERTLDADRASQRLSALEKLLTN